MLLRLVDPDPIAEPPQMASLELAQRRMN